MLWSSYIHLYNVREVRATNSINYLMIVSTFLPIFCLTLYGEFGSLFFLVPILFQIMALLILLKRFFIKGQIPWFKLEQIIKQLDNGTLESYSFATVKAAEDETWSRLKVLDAIIKRALFLLVLSIFFTAIAAVIKLASVYKAQSYAVAIVLCLSFLVLYFHYKEVPDTKKNFYSKENEYKNIIEKWLHEYDENSNSEPASMSSGDIHEIG